MPSTADAPPFLGRPGPSGFHRLNPLTKLTLALVTAIAAALAGGIVAPLALLVILVLPPGATAGVLGRLLRTALLLSAPIAISVLIVNLFFYPGGVSVLVRIGPIAATAEGLAFALETLARLAAISGALTLFYLTTAPSDLVIDLERRGVSPRLAFVVQASVRTVPAMLERAGAITAAQRARGLDTEGSVGRRLRGIVPLVGPVLLGTLAEVEERTLALEARGFRRPGRRTLLWAPGDTGGQRLARWALVAGLPLLVVARAAGWLTFLG